MTLKLICMRKSRGGGNPQEAGTTDCEARECAIGGEEEARDCGARTGSIKDGSLLFPTLGQSWFCEAGV